MQVHVFQISCDTQKWRNCVYTIRVLTTLGWDKLPVYLSRPGTCLPLDSRDVGIWLTSVSLTPARGWTLPTRALKGSHQVPWGNAHGRGFTTSRLPRGATVMKRSPHCLHPTWTAVTSIISFTEMSKFLTSNLQLGHVKHQEGKDNVHLSWFICHETFL